MAVDQHERTRGEIVEQVMTHWEDYTDSMPDDLNDPLSYAQRLLGRNAFGDYVEIMAAEVRYNRSFYVWDQATSKSPFVASHGLFLQEGEALPLNAVLLAHTEHGQHYSIVLSPEQEASLGVSPFQERPTLPPHALPLLTPQHKANTADPSPPSSRRKSKNERRIACRKRAYGRQQLRENQADNIVPEVQQPPASEQMKVCATSEGAISENAEISNPSTHQNDDSSASPSLATDSEGEEQKVLRRARKRNRFRAKQRKRRGQKGKRKKKPRRSRASEQSDAEMDVDSSDASLSMDEEDATEDDSDTASETSTSSSDEDDEILENLQKYVGKGFVTYAAAMGKGRDDVKPYVLEPLSLKDDAAIMCPHCQCRKWKGEKTNCCDGGTKLWPDYEPPPPHIIDIYRDRDFYAQQRRYNALFAMTAFGANKGPVIEKTPKTWVTYPGKSMLTLCGRAYHRIFDP